MDHFELALVVLTVVVLNFAALESCYNSEDHGGSYSGRVNISVSHDAACVAPIQEDSVGINYELQYVLDGNKCRNIDMLDSAPVCYIDNQTTVSCGIPECGWYKIQ